MRGNCIFCKIIEEELPSYKIFEDDFLLSILDIKPWSRGHVVIILKNHKENIFELSEAEAEKIFPMARKIAIAVKKATDCDGINVIQNNGETAGQTINHFHIHIIPRFEGDKVQIEAAAEGIEDFEAVKDKIIQNL